LERLKKKKEKKRGRMPPDKSKVQPPPQKKRMGEPSNQLTKKILKNSALSPFDISSLFFHFGR